MKRAACLILQFFVFSMHELTLFMTYTSVFQIGFLGHPGFPKTLMKAWAFCTLSELHFQQLTSTIMLNYQYEVIFKNGILHFQRECFGKKQVHNVRTFEPVWEVLPQEESKKGHCKHCLPPPLDQWVWQKLNTEISWILRQISDTSVTHYTRFKIDVFMKTASSVTLRN
jgi:hypothetical protein